jgi:hypothetical protein
VTLATNLKSFKRIELASLLFYAVTGIIFFVFLPLSNFAPQLGLLGIVSLIVTFGLFTKRGWAPWLLFVLFVAASAFSIFTISAAGFSNPLLGVGMIAYVALTWLFGVYIFLKRKTP